LYVEEGLEETSRQSERVVLAWNGEERLVVGGSKGSPYEFAAEESRKLPLLLWRKIKLPVEIIRYTYQEKIPYRVERTAEKAFEQAVVLAKAAAMRDFPLNGEIVNMQVRRLPSDGLGERVQVIYEIIADIAAFSPIAPR
ncbi:MAG: sporulation protein YqfD, partial [Clostridiales bacterium]|nr:sporulation protein YqfD [Clostridiales bacterium]